MKTRKLVSSLQSGNAWPRSSLHSAPGTLDETLFDFLMNSTLSVSLLLYTFFLEMVDIDVEFVLYWRLTSKLSTIYWPSLIAWQTQVITHINIVHTKDKYSPH